MEHLDLIVRWSLIAVVLVTALIGFLFIIRGAAVQHMRGVGADGTPITESPHPD